jgi:hypothetical protein
MTDSYLLENPMQNIPLVLAIALASVTVIMIMLSVAATGQMWSGETVK